MLVALHIDVFVTKKADFLNDAQVQYISLLICELLVASLHFGIHALFAPSWFEVLHHATFTLRCLRGGSQGRLILR